MNRISAMKLFWRTVSLLCVLLMAALAANAQTFEVVASLPASLGYYPSSLIQGTDGDFYGTTANYFADGSIFEYTPEGGLVESFTFSGEYVGSGSPLLLGTDGNYYGMTYDGGSRDDGSVFRVNPSGEVTTLYTFSGQDGQSPNSLVQAANGNFYGTTAVGGTSQNQFCVGDESAGCGTAFELSPTGSLTTLHSFNLGDGSGPSGLVQGSKGNFYGTTYTGGTHCYGNGSSGIGCGTVYQVTPTGKLTTLYNFCPQTPQCPDGFAPNGPLVEGADGNFYGTTSGGGTNCPQNSSCGTFFKITTSGKLTILYNFCAQTKCIDGRDPQSLIVATDGNFYGTTYSGGAGASGTIFQITPTGKLTTLYNFCSQTSCGDGGDPRGALVQDTNGTFYGTASYGGSYSNGTVFSLSMGLAPFVETVPIAGKISQKVTILGNNLTGATSVTFNGTQAEFDVVSATEILAMVPSGASTGIVQVVTPSGTLSSNVVFRLL